MKISFNQPAFIPWGGFYCRLMLSDCMILLDDTLLAQGFTFVNRNRIKGPGGELWTTVPLVRIHGQRQKIKDLKVHEKKYWAGKWLATLYHAYHRSLDFRDFERSLMEILRRDDDSFLGLTQSLLEFLKDRLGISSPFVSQSELGIKSSGQRLLLDVAEKLNAEEVILPFFARYKVDHKVFEKRGIRVVYLHYDSPVYPQFWGPYLRNLSVLDLLFCMGRDSRRMLEKGYKLIE